MGSVVVSIFIIRRYPFFLLDLINEKLLNENKRDAILRAPVVKIGYVIYSKTLELMTTFMGSWRRKNADSINYIQMNNFQQSKKADSSGPFIYLRSVCLCLVSE